MEGVIYLLLVHIFFISFIINLFITFYSIYSFFEQNLFHGRQGSKLKLKNFSKGG